MWRTCSTCSGLQNVSLRIFNFALGLSYCQWIFRPFKRLGRVRPSGILFLTTQPETSKTQKLSAGPVFCVFLACWSHRYARSMCSPWLLVWPQSKQNTRCSLWAAFLPFHHCAASASVSKLDKRQNYALPLLKMEDKKTWKTRPMIVDAGIPVVDAEVKGRDWFANRVCTQFTSQNLHVPALSLFLHHDETDCPRWLAKLRKYESTVPCHTASAWGVGGDRQRAYRSNGDLFTYLSTWRVLGESVVTDSELTA